MVTDDFVSHNPILAGPVRGPDGCRELATMFRSSFADVEMEFGDVMAQNDRVPLGLTTHATPVEAFAGVAPTNQELAITGRCFERFVQGKIAESFVDDVPLLSSDFDRVDPPEGGDTPSYDRWIYLSFSAVSTTIETRADR